MDYGDFLRVMVLNGIIAAVVTVLLCFVLPSLNIGGAVYLAPFFGLYVFSVHSINILVDDGIIQNDYSRIVLALICIVVYMVAFVNVVPMMFGSDFLSALTISDFVLDPEMILAIISLVMILINVHGYLKGR